MVESRILSGLREKAARTRIGKESAGTEKVQTEKLLKEEICELLWPFEEEQNTGYQYLVRGLFELL